MKETFLFCFSPRVEIVLKSGKPALKIVIIDGGETSGGGVEYVV